MCMRTAMQRVTMPHSADHGLSIVETGQVEPLYNFSIMMPDAELPVAVRATGGGGG